MASNNGNTSAQGSGGQRGEVRVGLRSTWRLRRESIFCLFPLRWVQAVLGLCLCHFSLCLRLHVLFFLCVCVSHRDTCPWAWGPRGSLRMISRSVMTSCKVRAPPNNFPFTNSNDPMSSYLFWGTTADSQQESQGDIIMNAADKINQGSRWGRRQGACFLRVGKES